MRAFLLVGFLFHLVTTLVHAEPDDEAVPDVLTERVIFRTQFGDLVFALYKDVAPAHTTQILKLVESGAYQGTHIFRVEPNSLMQVSRIRQRSSPLTEKQKNLERRLKGEFSKTLKHQLGSLTMAHLPGDPDSATSSFAIVLGDAPNLDGEYTLFGYVESGAKTVNRILSLPREGSRPLERVTIMRAFIHRNIDRYYVNNPIDPLSAGALDSENATTGQEGLQDATGAIVGLLLILVLLSAAGWLFFDQFSKGHLLSLLMLEALVAGFGLMVFATPWAQNQEWMAASLFIGLLAMFKFMNRFESKN